MLGREAGFALLTVLVALLLLSTVAVETLGRLEYLRRASENRVAQTQGFWAAQACLTLVRDQYVFPSPGGSIAPLDLGRIDLGRPGACRVVDDDPSARLNLNTTDSSVLSRIFTRHQVATLLDWRDLDTVPRSLGAERAAYLQENRWYGGDQPFRDVRELGLVMGFDSTVVESKEALFTTHGDGRVNPNRAPELILNALGLLPEKVVDSVLVYRRSGRRVGSVEQLLRLWPEDEDGSNDPMEEADASNAALEVRLLEVFSFDRRERAVTLYGWGANGPPTVTEVMVFLTDVDGQLVPRRLEMR